MAKPGQRPQASREAVRIITVDLPNRVAHVISKRDGRFKAGFRTVESLFQIPLKGETWIIERNTSWEWTLIKRQDRPAEHAVKTGLNQGDSHLRAPGILLIDTGGIQVLSGGVQRPLGPTIQETQVLGSATTSWTLTEAPVGLETVMLSDNGMMIDPTGITLVGNVLSFPSAATGHTLTVYYQIA